MSVSTTAPFIAWRKQEFLKEYPQVTKETLTHAIGEYEKTLITPNKFDEEILPQLQQDPQKVVSVQGSGSFVGAENAVVETPRTYDFLTVKNESNANTLKVTVQKKALSSAATTENEVAIANA